MLLTDPRRPHFYCFVRVNEGRHEPEQGSFTDLNGKCEEKTDSTEIQSDAAGSDKHQMTNCTAVSITGCVVPGAKELHIILYLISYDWSESILLR